MLITATVSTFGLSYGFSGSCDCMHWCFPNRALPILSAKESNVIDTFSGGEVLSCSSTSRSKLESNTIQNVRCVISDIAMRGMDGLELYRLLSQRYPTLPVILISGKDRSVIQRGDFAGTTFLQKPLDADEVIRAVSVALAHKN
jgi:FixJ family two-component response regulator